MTAANSRIIWLAPLLGLALLLGGCAGARGPSLAGYQSATAGAAVGAVAGALLDGDNRWKGGVIGGALGAVLGSALSEINSGAQQNYAPAPAAYGSYSPAPAPAPAYYAGYSPAPAPARYRCRTVVENHYRHGRLYSQTRRRVCD